MTLGPGMIACARCGKGLPSLATFCDGCGARVAPIATGSPAPAAIAVPTARPGFVAAGRGMPICHGCGAIAPTQRSTCGTCGAAIGTSLEAVPPRGDGAYWVQVRTELTCRQCGRRSPLDALDLDGTVQCGHCGAAQAFDVDAWSEGLAHAHAVGDLAAPALRGRDPNVRGGNPFAAIGAELASATLETSGMSIENGVMKTRNLALVAAPGQPLCASCGAPVDVDVGAAGGEAEAVTRCVACGERAQYRFPLRAKQMAPGLVAALADELRVDRPAARLDATSAGMVVAVRCPSCGGGLEVAEGAHAARCTYCGTHCRIPSRTLLALKKSPGAAAPWWLLFRGESPLRQRLARGGTEVEAPELDDDEEDERPQRRRKARKHTMLPMVELKRTPSEELVAWALQLVVPAAVLALIGVALFGDVLLAWAQGRMSKEVAPVTAPY